MNTGALEEKGEIYRGRTNAGVRQDKYPPRRIYKASVQPSTAESEPVSAIPPADNRPNHHGSETRQTAQIAGRAPFETKARIQSLAKTQGLSESQVVVSLVKKALQIDGDVQYGAMLRPVIQDQIHKDIQGATNRTANLALQAYYSAEQARILIIRILSVLLKDIEELPELIISSQKQAWENMRNFAGDMEGGTAAKWQ